MRKNEVSQSNHANQADKNPGRPDTDGAQTTPYAGLSQLFGSSSGNFVGGDGFDIGGAHPCAHPRPSNPALSLASKAKPSTGQVPDSSPAEGEGQALGYLALWSLYPTDRCLGSEFA